MVSMLAAMILLGLLGCQGDPPLELMKHCRELGFCEPLPSATKIVDLNCDASIGGPCNRQTLASTLSVLLPVLAPHPGSVLRLWGQDSEVAGLRQLGSVEVTAPRHPGSRVRRQHEESFVRASREALLRAAEGFFAAPARRRSPIAASLTLIARTAPPRPGMERYIVAITDMREVVPELGTDFECWPVSDPARQLLRWRRAQILPADSLRGVKVTFSDTALRPVEGRDCPATLSRAVAIENVWRHAIEAAGATSVRVLRGTATLDEGPIDGVRMIRADGGAQ